MKVYTIFPWVDWLIDQGPLTTALVFFAIDFGVLSIMNVIDIIFNFHGDPNARPRGHLTFWMVVVTDTLLLPAVGYSTIRFWQMANQTGLVLDPLASTMVDLVATVAGLSIVYVLVTGNAETSYTDWTFINGRLNIAGWWHTACMFIFVQYLTASLIKGVFAVWSLPISQPLGLNQETRAVEAKKWSAFLHQGFKPIDERCGPVNGSAALI